MAEEEKKGPKHIEKFYDLHEKVDLMMQETDLSHMDAYLQAHKWLEGKKKTHKDLDDEKLAEEFVNKMADIYVSKIKKRLGIKEDEKMKDLDEELLMSTYAGISKSQLMDVVKRTGKAYTARAHTAGAAKWVKDLENKLRGVASASIEDKHGKDVLDYMKSLGHTVEFLDPDKLRRDDLADMLSDYRKGEGRIPTREEYRKHVAYKKEEKEPEREAA